ncbi:hypothetical protein ACIO3S_01055 [Nocardioides sp. NPDC087217]|uniref:hypothetical protein n=1 Tax=Nocardioides sp. NPDC087217 TaxID=3364335 RepID=UPI003814CEA9
MKPLHLVVAAVVAAVTVIVPLSVVVAAESALAACSPRLSSLTLSASTVVGGRSTRATVKLSCSVRTRTKVAISAGAGLSAPTAVYVARGTRAKSFVVSTRLTSIRTSSKVRATFRQRTLSAALVRKPAACYPQSVGVSPASVMGGTAAVGKVTLTCLPASAKTVWLRATSGVGVPSSVTVGRNKQSATFRVTTSIPSSTGTSTVTARHGGRQKSRTFTRARCVPTINLPAPANAASTVNGSIVLGCETVSPVELKLSTNDGRLSVPATVTVPAKSRSVGFAVKISAKEASSMAASPTVKVSSAVGSASRSLVLDPGIAGVTFSADGWEANTYRFSFSLTEGALDGSAIKIASTTASDIPATFPLAKGYWLYQSKGPWRFESPDEDTVAKVTFTLGTSSVTVQIPVKRDFRNGDVFSIATPPVTAVSPPTEAWKAGGFRIKLDHQAGPAGKQLSVTTEPSFPGCSVETVDIAAGHTVADFAPCVGSVGTTTEVAVVVTDGVVTRRLAVTLEPALIGIELPAEVAAGQFATGQLRFAGPSDHDRIVTFFESVLVPDQASIVVPSGATTMEFSFAVPDSNSSAQLEAITSEERSKSVSSNTTQILRLTSGS